MAGKGGGAWKVAYADFVTAMMAFFLVMWITAQSKPVKEAVSQYFNDPSGASRASSGGASPSAPRQHSPPKAPKGGWLRRGLGSDDPGVKLLDTPPDHKGAANPHMLVIHDGNQSSVGSVILFAEDSTELSDEAQQMLKKFVPMLLGKPNKIELRGHAAQGAMRSGKAPQDPWQLSFARCMATKKFLEKEGIEPNRLRLSQAAIFEPHTLQPELKQQAQNSRVEMYVLGEWSEDLVGTPKERAARYRTTRDEPAAEAKPAPKPGKSP